MRVDRADPFPKRTTPPPWNGPNSSGCAQTVLSPVLSDSTENCLLAAFPVASESTTAGSAKGSDGAGRASLEYVSSAMPRLLRTLAVVTLIVVLTDVTWDGKSLRISIGVPGRRRIIQLVFP